MKKHPADFFTHTFISTCRHTKHCKYGASSMKSFYRIQRDTEICLNTKYKAILTPLVADFNSETGNVLTIKCMKNKGVFFPSEATFEQFCQQITLPNIFKCITCSLMDLLLSIFCYSRIKVLFINWYHALGPLVPAPRK